MGVALLNAEQWVALTTPHHTTKASESALGTAAAAAAGRGDDDPDCSRCLVRLVVEYGLLFCIGYVHRFLRRLLDDSSSRDLPSPGIDAANNPASRPVVLLCRRLPTADLRASFWSSASVPTNVSPDAVPLRRWLSIVVYEAVYQQLVLGIDPLTCLGNGDDGTETSRSHPSSSTTSTSLSPFQVLVASHEQLDGPYVSSVLLEEGHYDGLILFTTTTTAALTTTTTTTAPSSSESGLTAVPEDDATTS